MLRRREGRSKRRNGGWTTGKLDRLVRMANQIGDFYASMPEREGTGGAASHLRLYWTPKKIRETTAFADEGHPRSHAGSPPDGSHLWISARDLLRGSLHRDAVRGRWRGLYRHRATGDR